MSLTPFHLSKYHRAKAFTLAEVVVAIAVAALFGGAAFATNQRLLIALKNQKETTAATMMLQARMEAFRGATYTNNADATWVSTNIVQVPPQTPTTPPIMLEAPLGSLSETITVSGYLLATGGTASTHGNSWTRNATYPTGHSTDTNTTLATNYDLLQITIQLTWASKDGRSRTRSVSTVVGRGNIGS